MNIHKASFWVIMSALASVVIVALAWVLAISPTLATTEAARVQAEEQRNSNDLLQLQLVKLADQFTHLDEYKADLASMRLQIPAGADLSALNTELRSLADSTGVTLSEITPSPPMAFVPVVAAPAVVAAAPVTEAGTAAPAEGTAAAAAPAAAPSTAPAGMYAIQLSLTASGTYDQAMAFLSSFQTGSQRLFLVMTVNATATTSATGAAAGLPPMNPGDLTLSVTGLAYVLDSGAAPVVEPPVDPTAPLVLPEPSGQKNPFVSVG
ncbi:MAG: hypothetical protein ACOH2F_16915 [Cellulomonas sp.]